MTIYLREKIDKIGRGRSNRLLVFTMDIKSADLLHDAFRVYVTVYASVFVEICFLEFLIIHVVSFAAVFGMSRNAPPK